MDITDSNFVKSEDLDWTSRSKSGKKSIGERIRLYPFGDQLRGYMAAAFSKAVGIEKAQSYRIRLADGPPGYIYLKSGTLKGAKLTRQNGQSFTFAATGLTQGTQVPHDKKTLWELDRIREDHPNQSIVRLKEITW